MNNYLLLLSPRVGSFRNRLKRGEEGSLVRLLVLGGIALAFWIGVFYGFYRVLGYFQSAEGFGFILARKLMGMLWLTFFSILLFSNVINSLSTFFLSKDLEMMHASPVPKEHLFWARLTDTLVDSSWMIFLFGLPIFLAYGIVFGAGPIYYVKLAAVSGPFMILASSLAVIFTMVLVNIFPARRTKDILLLLSIALIVILYLLFRFLRPERLVNPNEFTSAVGYFAAIGTPGSPFLPSVWATEVLWPSLAPGSYSDAGFNLLLLLSTSAAAAVFASWVSGATYTNGFTKSQEGARRFINQYNPVEVLIRLVGRPFRPESRVLIAKEIKTFFRDNTQWSQLLLLLALIVIYLYNFSVLDLEKYPLRIFWLQNLLAFLNIGLASFVVTSLCVRFVFPAVSQEGFSYWIIRTSPISLKRFMWTKYGLYVIPLVVMAEILIVFSNILLDVGPTMMAFSTVTVFLLVLGIIGLGVGLGAVYPRFEAENMAQVATGFGGLIFMITAALYVAAVIVAEAYPVILILRYQSRGVEIQTWQAAVMALCFAAVLAMNAAAVLLPMKMGRLRLQARESEG